MNGERTPLWDDDAITVEILSRAQVLRGHDYHQWLTDEHAMDSMKVIRDSYEARIAELEAECKTLENQRNDWQIGYGIAKDEGEQEREKWITAELEAQKLHARIAELEAQLAEANANIPKIQEMAYHHGYIAGQGYKG